jgi:hypothetical protein
MSIYSFFSKLFPSRPATAKVPTVVEAIKLTEAETNAARLQVEFLRAQLQQAENNRRTVLAAGQQTIETALASEQEALKAEEARHQEQLTNLNTYYQRQKEALQRRIEQLAETQTTSVAAAQNEFDSFVGDAKSRANKADMELARIQEMLGN